jgi:hypothetical protein
VNESEIVYFKYSDIQKDVPIAAMVVPALARGVFLADQMITSAVLNGKGRLPLS